MTVFVKNPKDEYFQIDLLNLEYIDDVLDQLNNLNGTSGELTFIREEVTFKKPFQIELTNDKNDVIAILTHELSLLTSSEIKCRCIHFDGACHNCGAK